MDKNAVVCRRENNAVSGAAGVAPYSPVSMKTTPPGYLLQILCQANAPDIEKIIKGFSVKAK